MGERRRRKERKMDKVESQGRGRCCQGSLGPWDLGRRKRRRTKMSRRWSGNEQAKRKNGHGSNERDT